MRRGSAPGKPWNGKEEKIKRHGCSHQWVVAVRKRRSAKEIALAFGDRSTRVPIAPGLRCCGGLCSCGIESGLDRVGSGFAYNKGFWVPRFGNHGTRKQQLSTLHTTYETVRFSLFFLAPLIALPWHKSRLGNTGCSSCPR